MTYSFEEQDKKAQVWAKEIDDIIDRWFEHRLANGGQDRAGIDRYFRPRIGGAEFSVQYKADDKAAETGNIFVELLSNDKTGKSGWALECRAVLFLIYVPQKRLIYFVSPWLLRDYARAWLLRPGQKPVPNPTYNTIGIPIPIPEFEASVCTGVFDAETGTMRNRWQAKKKVPLDTAPA